MSSDHNKPKVTAGTANGVDNRICSSGCPVTAWLELPVAQKWRHVNHWHCGCIIAEGTPEQVADSKGSHTGRFLKPMLATKSK